MKQYKLDKEEQEILEAFEKGELIPVENQAEAIKEAMLAARNTPKDYHGGTKDAEVFMLEDDTIKKLKTKAKKQGIPYKDLAVSVLQKFANS